MELVPFRDQPRYRIVASRQDAKGSSDAPAATVEREKEPEESDVRGYQRDAAIRTESGPVKARSGDGEEPRFGDQRA